MIGKYIKTGAAAVFLGTAGAGAAPIDLADLGFQEGTPSNSGSGGVFYDFDSQTLSDDFLFPIRLDDFTDSLVTFLFDPFGPNLANVFYEGDGLTGDFELFTITESGDNEGDTLELLLSRDSFDLSNGTAGVGMNAVLRITSSGFDFSNKDPFDFFDENSVDVFGVLEYATDVDITLTALERTTPIPLPAPAFLLLGALAGLGTMRRSRRTG